MMKQLGQRNQVLDWSFCGWKHCNTSYLKACRGYWMGSTGNGAFIFFRTCTGHNVLYWHEWGWWLQYTLRYCWLWCSSHYCTEVSMLVICEPHILSFRLTKGEEFAFNGWNSLSILILSRATMYFIIFVIRIINWNWIVV